MFRWARLLFVGVVGAAILGACGVAIVRPVTVNTHKRPTFNMTKVNRIAVLAGTGAQASSAADIMSLGLLNHGYNVIERARIKEVLAENKIQLANDEDIKTANKLAQLLDADSILIVSISDMTSGQQMIPGGCMTQSRIETVVAMGTTARLIDIANSEIIWVGAASTQDKGLQQCLMRMNNKLIESM